MYKKYRHSISSWGTYERRYRDFSSALFCIAAGLGWLVGLLTFSWLWASLTIVGLVLLAYFRDFKPLISREDTFIIIFKAGIVTNLLIVPLDISLPSVTVQLELTSWTRVSSLLLSFGIPATLWFLWKAYDFPRSFEYQRQLSEDNRRSLVAPEVIALIVPMIGCCPLLVLYDSFPDRFPGLLLLEVFVGVLGGLWLGTGSAFLWVTLWVMRYD